MGKASRKKANLSITTPKKENKREESSTAIVKTEIVHKPIVHILLIVVFGLIVYSNTFHASFHFDDGPNIQENPIIKDLRYFIEPSSAKTFPLYDALKSRFIGYLSFALNYKMHGLKVTGYHIVNLAIHLINALLVYWIVVLTFRTPVIRLSSNHNQRFADVVALFSALLFVSHPVQTQAVTYIVQRLASLATMFYLLSFASYIKSRLSMDKATKYLLYGISFFSAILAMKTKEIAFTLPLMIAMYEAMFLGGKPARRMLYLTPLLLTMAIIPFTLLSLNKPIGSLISDVSEATRLQTTISRTEYLFTQFRVIVTYIRLLFVPIGQNLDYDYPIYYSFLEPQVFLSFLIIAGIICLGIYLLYRYRGTAPCTRLISFGIFWFFVTISVESSIIPIVDVIFEHRMYLPSVGAFIAIMASLFAAKNISERKWIQINKSTVTICILVVIALSGTAYSRNVTWQHEITLWRDVVEKSPKKARAHNNLGIAYRAKGELDMAMEQYQAALRLEPDHAEAHNNLGTAYRSKGELDMAIEQYQTALRLKPDYEDAHNNIGIAYASKGQLNMAMEQFQTALRLKPDYADAHFNLGLIYLKEGSIEMARTEFEVVLRIKPDYHRARQILNNVSSRQH